MAAGFKLDRRREADMQAYLGERLAVSVAAVTASRPLAIDGALSSAGANTEFMALLDRAGPYGAGHPEPRFAFPAHRVSRLRIINDEHVRCTLSAANGARLEAAAFRVGDTPLAKLLLKAERSRPSPPRHLERPGWCRAHRRGCRGSLRLSLACPRQQSFLYEPKADRLCMPAKPPSSNGQDVRFST